MGDRHGVRQVADHANRSLGVDHLQQPALPQRLSIIQMWSKRLKAASLEPCRVIVDLIDDVIGSLGKCFLGLVGYDQKPKTAGETKVICRPSFLLQLGDVAVIYISGCPRHGEPIAEADGATQRRRCEAAEPDRWTRFLDRLGRHSNVLEIEKIALEGDGSRRIGLCKGISSTPDAMRIRLVRAAIAAAAGRIEGR